MKDTVTQNTTHSPPASFFTKRYFICQNSGRLRFTFFFNLILLCCFLIATTSCEKYLADQSPPPDLEKKSFRLNHYGNAGIFSAIPADISQYNLLTGEKTKSSADNMPNDSSASATFCLDSALLWHLEQQLYFAKENILYRQIPLQMEGGKIYCSIADKFYAGTSGSQNTGSLSEITKVKSYCIIVEAPHKGEQRKYLVTMFPEYSSTGFNENCTYLEKGNYSGLIIFSSVEGVFQKIEHYRNGLVLPGAMLTAEELSATGSDNVKFLTIYQAGTSSAFLPLTKDMAFTLDSVTVVATTDDKETKKKENEEAGGGGDTPPALPPTEGSGYDNEGGSGNSSGNDEEAPIYYTLTLTTDGGGTADGGGRYTAGTNATIQAGTNDGYIFGGWSGDYGGMAKSAIVQMNSDKHITAHFYSLTSECGKLKKALSNYDSLLVYRDKLLNNSNLEYGYTKSPDKSRTGVSQINKLKTTTFFGMTEMVHTHALEIHLSLSDLRTLYSSYARGFITDTENFTYTVVSPEYFVVLQIEDEEKVRDVINNSMISTLNDNGKMTYKFIDNVAANYKELIPSQSDKSIEEYFSEFINFINDMNSGLSVSLHKTDTTTNEVISKFITDSSDVQDLISLKEICK